MKERGLFNVMVSNGYIEKGPLQALLPISMPGISTSKGFPRISIDPNVALR